MKLTTSSQAGTLESSDMLVSIAPAPEGAGITLNLVSPALRQYGDHIRQLICSVLTDCGVTDATVDVNDKGAVDFVIEARIKTAVLRAAQA